MSKKRGTDAPRAAAAKRTSTAETVRDMPVAVEWLVAIGLALVMLARPVWDGSVYQYVNLWFLYGIYALFAVWGIALLLSGGSLRFTRHLALLGAFLALAGILGINTIQADQTYHGLLLWLSYLLLFLLASNALRSRATVALVLGAFVVATFGEVVFSWVHVNYILPFLRRQIVQYPGLLMTYFGANTLTPELASRLNANRAFGSFLFANALAAYLVVGIPYFVGELANSLARFRSLPKHEVEEPGQSPYTGKRAVAVLLGLSVWFVSFCVAFFVYPQVFMFIMDRKDWWTDTAPMIEYVGILPIALGVVPGLFIGIMGRKRGWYAFQCVFLALLVCTATYILWLTFSRGGVLALVLASIVGVALLWWARRSPSAHRPEMVRAAAAGAGIVLVLASAFAGMTDAAAQAAAPAVQAAPAPTAPPPDPNAPKLLEQGVDLKLTDLASPATLEMRSAYWRIALRMGLAHFWAGTGLGTFQTAYPRFQDIGAPPVKAAHNDYLQVFSEVGIFGILFFIGFWGFFLVWGLLRIPREPQRGKRWALTGLYVGILAFLIHSLVDFNFYNPSLAMTQFMLAGLFLSRTGVADTTTLRRLPQHAALVLLLALTALATATAARVHVAHAVVGDDPVANTRFLIAETLSNLNPETYRADNLLRYSYTDLAMLVPDRKAIESLGTIYLPTGTTPPTFHPVLPDAPLSKEEIAQALVLVRNPANANKAAREGLLRRISDLEWAHKLYPHNPQVVAELFRWSDFLRHRAKDKPEEQDLVMSMLKWSEEGVRISPESAAFRGYHGNSLLRRGLLEKDPKRAVEFYRQAIQEYRNSTERWPSSESLWSEYANVLRRYGEAFKKYGLKEEGDRYIQEAQRAAEVVKHIQETKNR